MQDNSWKECGNSKCKETLRGLWESSKNYKRVFYASKRGEIFFVANTTHNCHLPCASPGRVDELDAGRCRNSGLHRRFITGAGVREMSTRPKWKNIQKSSPVTLTGSSRKKPMHGKLPDPRGFPAALPPRLALQLFASRPSRLSLHSTACYQSQTPTAERAHV